MCVAWLTHAWHDSSMCATWLIHMCDVTHPCAWLDSFKPNKRVNSFICVKPRINIWSNPSNLNPHATPSRISSESSYKRVHYHPYTAWPYKKKTGRYSQKSACYSEFDVQLGFHRNNLVDSVIIIWVLRDLTKTEGGLSHVCAVTHSCTWRNSFTSATWLIQKRARISFGKKNI